MTGNRRRRGMSLALFVAIAIIVAFSGRYAWKKYQRSLWLEKTEPKLLEAGRVLKDAWRSATYPSFMVGGTMTPIRGKDKELVIHAESKDVGNRMLASVHADEKLREVAHWMVCTPSGNTCTVVFHRLYFDGGKAFGVHEQYIAPLYLERRTVEITQHSLPELKAKLEATEGEHEKMTGDAARVRFFFDSGALNSATPAVEFEILCLQPVDEGEQRTAKGLVDLSVGVTLQQPQRTRVGLK